MCSTGCHSSFISKRWLDEAWPAAAGALVSVCVCVCVVSQRRVFSFKYCCVCAVYPLLAVCLSVCQSVRVCIRRQSPVGQNWYHFLSLYFILSWCDVPEYVSASSFIRSVVSSSSLSFSPRSRAACIDQTAHVVTQLAALPLTYACNCGGYNLQLRFNFGTTVVRLLIKGH